MYDSNLALIITIATKFLAKHCIKRVLDTEMNGYHCFNFIACEQALFELSLKFEREPAGLANKNASVRCLERRRVPIG
jgi:hypothetical protein